MTGQTEAPATNALKVPGASLYYEVRGTGPVLLMIVGGNGDAGTFGRVADALADRYTVVSYDRRGFSRSPLDGPAVDEQRITADSDDVHRLLAHLTDEPAYVFGSSSGAIVALDFLARYPDQARGVVAHEPPAVALLPDAERHLAFLDEVYDIYRRDGLEPAMGFFAAGIGLRGLEPPSGTELPQPLADMMARVGRNLEFWMEHELRQYPRFVPDIAALEPLAQRLVLAGGRDSRDQLPFLPNVVLAGRLGTGVVHFAGGHAGYATHPAEFADRLAAVLRDHGD